MLSIFNRKKVVGSVQNAAGSVLNQGAEAPLVEINPKLGLNVQYGISIICKQKGEASLIINGLEPQLIELIAAGLKTNKRFLKLVREGFRKANLPIK